MAERKIAIIGAGRIGEALLSGLLSSGWRSRKEIVVTSRNESRVAELRELRGRPVEGWETAELLEPYGEWSGLASVYLLAGYARGLLPVGAARAA